MLTLPSPPEERDWTFVQELQTPEVITFFWNRLEPSDQEADLRGGISLRWKLGEPLPQLDTAVHDLCRSLGVAGLSVSGNFIIELGLDPALVGESYRIVVARDGGRLMAGSPEGLRRAIYALEEMLRCADGPFLPLGERERTAVVQIRLSRCFFGPIKRPPRHRDELADEENYYPDEYLSRLAREGVNGLWLTIAFHELAPSRFFPGFGSDSQRRLEKLRRTVAQCARYGIGIYLFCIEPMGFGDNVHFLHPLEHLRRNPELEGHCDNGFVFFCTSTKTGRAYLEESTRYIFSEVPELAGLICINMGERPTHCYSSYFWDTQPNRCPRCSKKTPGEVFYDLLSALKRGMQYGNPSARLISWLYVPTVFEQPDHAFERMQEEVAEIAAHFPEDVIFQYNFESMGTVSQLGKERIVRDYSLAYGGPSAVFQRCAGAALGARAAVAAKLQVGCSHEVATVPWVPVPGNLFGKYRAMHGLGVSAAMQSWYFGTFPSLMTRAAGRLSFSPLPETEEEFLYELALPEWGSDAGLVAGSWRLFSEAYREFPANVNFSWYGPVHDSVAWPLYLKPQEIGIAPSWRLGYAPSGDRIGESIGEGHDIGEVAILCERMVARWQAGMELLHRVSPERRAIPKLAREIGVAEAMGIQLRSALNVVNFYRWREELFRLPPECAEERRGMLERLRDLVRAEMVLSGRMIPLATEDSRLGFHSEAEGHKYFPKLLRWRIERLQEVLDGEFPEVEAAMEAGEWLFPEYTGVKADGPLYEVGDGDAGKEGEWAHCLNSEGDTVCGYETRWRATVVNDTLMINLRAAYPTEALPAVSTDVLSDDHIVVRIEPRRLWPAVEFIVARSGRRYDLIGRNPARPGWTSECREVDGAWHLDLEIPLAFFGRMARLPRINVIRNVPGMDALLWVPLNPYPQRLLLGTANPADFGWLSLP